MVMINFCKYQTFYTYRICSHQKCLMATILLTLQRIFMVFFQSHRKNNQTKQKEISRWKSIGGNMNASSGDHESSGAAIHQVEEGSQYGGVWARGCLRHHVNSNLLLNLQQHVNSNVLLNLQHHVNFES